MTVREATRRDVEVIVSIHAACFTLLWSRASIHSLIEDEQGFVLVAEDRYGAILGYLSARDVYDGFELLNIAVLPDARGRGVGRALLDGLFAALPRGVPVRVHLEVRESNQAARRLYEHYGFKVVSRREHYYPDTGEAALLMTYLTGAQHA